MADTITIYSPAATLGVDFFSVDSEEKPSCMLDLFKAQTTDSFLVYGQRYWKFFLASKVSNPITHLVRQILILFYQYYRGDTTFNNMITPDPQAVVWVQAQVVRNILFEWIPFFGPLISACLCRDALTGKVTEFKPKVESAVSRPLGS